MNYLSLAVKIFLAWPLIAVYSLHIETNQTSEFRIMSGPIATIVKGSINGALNLAPCWAPDVVLQEWEKGFTADIAEAIGARIDLSVRATVRDSLCTPGI